MGLFSKNKGEPQFYKINFEFTEIKASVKSIGKNSFKIELKRGNQTDYTESYKMKLKKVVALPLNDE